MKAPRQPGKQRRFVLCASLAVALAAAVSVPTVRGWWSSVPDKPASRAFRRYMADPGARMVAYSPDLGDDDNANAVVERELAVLRQKFDGIALYRCDGETEVILQAAAALHFRAVLLTVWSPDSHDEVALAARLVRSYHDRFAMAVSIGSEGLMEGRYTMNGLKAARIRLLRETATATNVETTTTEPWWLYLKPDPQSAELRGFGDFLSMNIHVVWDTDIADPAAAAEWTEARAEEVQAASKSPVLIREAGFPGGGVSPRESAHVNYTRTAQAEFWKSWFGAGRALPPIVVFEAVDNPAKHWRSFESTWGLMSPELTPYPAWNVFPKLGSAGD